MLNKKWGPAVSELGLPHSRDMSITKFLADETTVGEWNLEELPTDELSVQNGIIVTSSSRYPLLIDPQGQVAVNLLLCEGAVNPYCTSLVSCPLLVYHFLQGKNWLKKRGEKHGVVVTNLNNRMFRQHLEDALQVVGPWSPCYCFLVCLFILLFSWFLRFVLQLGTPLIIEDVGEELDPVLDPVLEKQVRLGVEVILIALWLGAFLVMARDVRFLVLVFVVVYVSIPQFVRSGSKGLKVKLGDKELDVMDGFNLYLTTKLGNPNYTPETFAKVSIIDFAVTLKGLEDQLLGIVILKEKHELEEERQLLLEEITENKKKIAKCEVSQWCFLAYVLFTYFTTSFLDGGCWDGE